MPSLLRIIGLEYDKSCPPTVYKKHYPPALNDEVWRLEKIETESSTQMTLFLTIRSLVKRAYDNWMHVIEYDGRSFPDLKQNQGSKTLVRKLDAISLPLQNLLVNTSQKIQAPGTDNLNRDAPVLSPASGMDGQQKQLNSVNRQNSLPLECWNWKRSNFNKGRRQLQNSC
ncbi:CALMODULIN-BINDING PROTEIN 60 D-LIKE [Salix viminalis]|uniref:CALMODULIN-BINDING PROTEIN 60 D-LIKE n=1 Tax=Salix viminalis TaxID=40686 RepID=A0A9Q0TAT2_SALVM|nr:CALMODULIN-BINDING PROTEIN 60 D-LIKE [Salix viminalis]